MSFKYCSGSIDIARFSYGQLIDDGPSNYLSSQNYSGLCYIKPRTVSFRLLL